MEETIDPRACRICGCTTWVIVDGLPVCRNCHPELVNDVKKGKPNAAHD